MHALTHAGVRHASHGTIFGFTQWLLITGSRESTRDPYVTSLTWRYQAAEISNRIGGQHTGLLNTT